VPDDVSSDVAGLASIDEALSFDAWAEPGLSPSPGASSSPGASPTPAASPSPAASATPTPTPRPSPTLPPTADGALPAGLVPSLLAARADKPKTYVDGCHLDQPIVAFGSCVYGDPYSRTTVVLFGDSHAAQWFPTLERIAREKGLRLVSLTKSACTAADVQVWSSTYRRAYTECDTWRSSAFARIAAERPALVVVASSRSFQPMAAGRATEGEGARTATSTGLARTIRRLEKSAGAVTIIGDTPLAPLDPPNCLSANTGHVLRCATPVEKATDPAWTAMERSVATAWGATFVDPTRWVCPSSPCPAVIGRYLVSRDTHHLATPFVTALSTRLARALPTPRR
jgi:hypothetical protein